jgi:hypothetical protein
MAVRVQVVVDRLERERFRRRASEQGMSLSAWLREAGREKAADGEAKRRMTPAALRAFFKRCDTREKDREPDWERHREVIARSMAKGQSGT